MTDLHITPDKYFKITSIHRDDFEARGYDASQLADEKLERIASKMADTYLDSGLFWESVDFWAKELSLPVTKHKDLY